LAGSDPHDTDPLADTAAPAVDDTRTKKKRAVHSGDTIGRYELGDDVGEGGMATVYRARDKELRRDVAVKVLFPHLARRPEIVRRFQREARAAAGLEHANILRIYDVGGDEDSDDPPFIVMELVRGTTLLGEIELRGPMFAEVVACVGALLADALAAAHAAGIIHRDIKPANVLVAPGGKILLADFGVARLETEDSLVTKTGALLGTPAYMSPEQAAGDIATAKSDLYSLGATLYQLATGTLPYAGSPAKVIAQIAAGMRVAAVKKRAEVGPDLSRVIDRLMATEPDDRPGSAKEVAAELRIDHRTFIDDDEAGARGRPIVIELEFRRAVVVLACAIDQRMDGGGPDAALRAHHQGRLASESGEGRLALRPLSDMARQRRLADAGITEQPEHLRLAGAQPLRHPVEGRLLLARPIHACPCTCSTGGGRANPRPQPVNNWFMILE